MNILVVFLRVVLYHYHVTASFPMQSSLWRANVSNQQQTHVLKDSSDGICVQFVFSFHLETLKDHHCIS